MERFRAGDDDAFKFLYDTFHQRLFLTIFNYLGQRDVAEDIVSNAFMKLFDRRSTIRDLDHVYAFLYVAARNEAVDHLRSEKRRRDAFREQEGLADEEYHDPRESELEKERWMAKIMEAVELLPPARQKVFRLLYFDSLSIREIANRLKLTETTVRNQRNRALITLRRAFSL